MDCYVTDSGTYLTMFSYVRINLDSGRVEYVHIRISGLRSVIEKAG